MTLGLASGHVRLSHSHDAWATAFASEQAKILEALGQAIVSVEHVGSTSIRQVPAKPILDILIGVQDFEEARVCIPKMAALGYTYRGENGIPRRHYFVKGEPRTHHVHMLELASEDWRNMLRFRDLLRSHPALARAYTHEKERLARLHSHNRKAYQREKSDVIQQILFNDD